MAGYTSVNYFEVEARHQLPICSAQVLGGESGELHPLGVIYRFITADVFQHISTDEAALDVKVRCNQIIGGILS